MAAQNAASLLKRLETKLRRSAKNRSRKNIRNVYLDAADQLSALTNGKGGHRKARNQPNGHITFSRPAVVTMLKKVSDPRMRLWKALSLPLGPRNPRAQAIMRGRP